MKPFSDLNAILQDGYSFRCDMPHSGVQKVTISTHQIDELVLTSGKLLAWDLLMIPDERYSFKKTLEPGRYPVVLSVADFYPMEETRIACAMLLIAEERAVRWEIALINNPSPAGLDLDNYGVDSGTGSFMDVEAARTLVDLTYGQTDGGKRFEKYCELAIAELEKNLIAERSSAQWANMQVSDTTEPNIIMFSSGWGDGGYASFWGYDASGNLTSLVTDFALF